MVGTVLITGASRGIGRTTALRLATAGWEVIGGVRRPEDGEALTSDPGAAGRIRTVALDVTDDAQIGALSEQLPGRLDAVVNNAGGFVGGPMEALSAEQVRAQLELNVVGQVAVTNVVLPRLRDSRGRIVFVSSLNGLISVPLGGAYSASKFALEAIADAWRIELRPWGIGVSLVEPAMTDTDIWRTMPEAQAVGEAAMSPEHRSLYERHLSGFRKTTPRLQKMAKPADTVAAAIESALTDRRPRARYVVGADARVQVALMGVLPTRLKDIILAAGTGVPVRRR